MGPAYLPPLQEGHHLPQDQGPETPLKMVYDGGLTILFPLAGLTRKLLTIWH
jgi:hypothetical protein